MGYPTQKAAKRAAGTLRGGAQQKVGVDAPALTPHEITRLKAAVREDELRQAAELAAVRQKYDCQGETVGGLSAAVPRPVSPFEMVNGAAGEVGGLSVRVVALADKLTGGIGQESQQDKPARSGHLGIVADLADSISHAVRVAHAALDRIEQQLP